MPTTRPPLDSQSATRVLAALQSDAQPLAAVDAQGVLQWWNARFAALFAPPDDPAQGLARWLGPADARRLLAGEALERALPLGDSLEGNARPWRLQAGPPAGPGGLQLLRAEPQSELHDLRREVEQLRERLDLVQTFSDTGVFERDPHTLAGTWDRHMYRIWGLPEPPPGSPSPAHAEVTARMLPDDRGQEGLVDTLNRPGPHGQRVRIQRPDGEVRHLHARWKVFHDALGRPLRVLGINTDVSEVYELANRAERLRTELDAALALGHIAVWRHDLGTGRVTFDPRGFEIIGLPHCPQGLTLAEARARMHPDDLPRIAAAQALTLRTGEPNDTELRYLQAGGGWKHVLARRALQRAPNGAPLALVGVMLDVTERVEQDRLARESARRLEAAAEAARIGLWSTSADSALPNWNPRMYTLFGLDPQAGPLPLDDWLGRCVHPDDSTRVRSAVVSWWLAGQGGIELDIRILRPSDGAQRWLVVRGEVTRGEQGRHAEGVAIDVTEQQQVLRQLRQTVERTTMTNEALGLGTWEADRGHRQIRWDAQMFRLRGIESPARVIDREEIASYLHPDERRQVMGAQAGRLLDGQPWSTEFRVLRPDGQVRWITSQSVPIHDEHGFEERRIGVNWDNTEAHVAAQALRQAELALAQSQAKAQTLSRISHELRTPLNAVLGFSQLLRLRQDDTDPAQRARWLAHIDEAGRHLLALIDDVLELSSAEAGELRLSPQALPLAPFIEATLPLVSTDATARGVELQQGPVCGTVLADPLRLRQVLINLLSNAIKYNRRGGLVRMAAATEGGWVDIEVRDTGLGIAADRLVHAFEPFNRLGAEASGIEGSGMGLAIVKALVEQMGGSVRVHSQPDWGTTFTVRLRAASASASASALVPAAPATTRPQAPCNLPVAEAAPSPTASATGPARLLYIEDNPVNALLVRELLATRPAVTLDVADCGVAGVHLARLLLPDLILVDMLLPDIDGLAVLQALRADPRTAAIRCVALSANATPADQQAARAAGFVDYWTKPIDFDPFLRGLGALLGREV